jgi:EEF1A lysine methyltransferase 2
MAALLKDHWNKKYTDTPMTQLGWYEPLAVPSIQFIENCAVPKQSLIVDMGSGTSTLIASLLELGYQNLFAIDISEVALEKAKSLLNKEQAAQVHWMVDDITHPSSLLQLQNIAVWHDRAVFHFLTDAQNRQTYRSFVQKAIMPGGFMLIATFALDGADRCSGLPVQRYSADDLCAFFGDEFKLIESLDFTYKMPSGDARPYVYTRFQKIPAG